MKSAQGWFGSDNSSWVLQEDKDLKHIEVVRVRSGNVKMASLDWPFQSPDANSIENMWAVMKVKLKEKKVFNLKQFVRHIREI